ncbi:hypothetical protein PAXRUDRAFT_825453 [Paxillus rubicundulus Ve08.2h10]|uniref:Uncharacterized protein n=1 Tax=Paxillus rubicundulus Ve08.2h10 TaxID=930991 RepID=A0A0D0DT72_9AGAM|nr:hypothetical protein PAXRUDRAFT_825453 [Paxillus rubicundulus Ve08.2h10]
MRLWFGVKLTLRVSRCRIDHSSMQSPVTTCPSQRIVSTKAPHVCPVKKYADAAIHTPRPQYGNQGNRGCTSSRVAQVVPS